MSQNNMSARWIIGVVLLVLGGMLLLENVMDMRIFHLYLPWWVFSWHSIMIILGIIILATTSNKTAGLIVLGIGVFTMLPHWWPLLLVLLGIYLLTRKENSSFNFNNSNLSGNVDPDMIEVVTVFGGCNKIFQSDNFKGGTIFAAFGGSEINLHGCRLAEGTNVIDVTAIFGGSSIQAPSEWNIKLDVIPIFGGISDKRIKSPNIVYDETRTLLVKGVSIFGGIDIKN